MGGEKKEGERGVPIAVLFTAFCNQKENGDQFKLVEAFN